MTNHAARAIGQSARDATYWVPDDQLAVGSTLGGPRITAAAKANGSLEQVYSDETGERIFGPVVLRFFDERSGMHLAPEPGGTFLIHAEHQEHQYSLSGDLTVHEDLCVLCTASQDDAQADPPAVYYAVAIANDGDEARDLSTYAFVSLRGDTAHDVEARYDESVRGLLVWNASTPRHVRVFGCSEAPTSYEVTLDAAKGVAEASPGELSGQTDARADPLGILRLHHPIKPGERAEFAFLMTCSTKGRRAAIQTYHACPPYAEALARTTAYYHEYLSRSVVLTPNPQVNTGVLWAKANMLRVERLTPTGWGLTNDPMRSRACVGRDTAWFAYGADYITPRFARDSLLGFVRRQEPSGKIVEFYDLLTGASDDYGLNINDNTPLLILGLWHHYNTTGDLDFLREIYPAAAKAARYIVSQENDQGLVWCTATATGERGIIGWRNVIAGYRLSGATTEVNSECYAALRTVSHMARVLDRHEESAEFAQRADALNAAINEHLYNPKNGLYYLNIDVDGHPRSDVTSDLVFPVIFGVATGERAARIIGRLSDRDFWTPAGMRTTPRDAPSYSPTGGWGLLGGVWVAVSFWYAFAAARHTPEFMDHALGTSFQIYSTDPIRYNTVPGQFSEWLDGETLVNRGMMLSPWFPPRYLWAAIEGAAGLDLASDTAQVHPRLARDWQWLGVQNVLYRGRRLTWFAVRAPELRMYTNFHFQETDRYLTYEEDISADLHATHDAVCALGLRQGQNIVLFVGNTSDRTTGTALRVDCALEGAYRPNTYDSLIGQWNTGDLIAAEHLSHGLALHIERKGFQVIELRQEI